MTYSCDFEIRYGEVDLQGVVFNANYLAYVDHCIDRWLRSLNVLTAGGDWDIMVKKASVEWHDSAGLGDVLMLVPRVTRWGTTSSTSRSTARWESGRCSRLSSSTSE